MREGCLLDVHSHQQLQLLASPQLLQQQSLAAPQVEEGAHCLVLDEAVDFEVPHLVHGHADVVLDC